MYYLALVFEAEDGLDFVCPDVPGFTAHSDSRSFNEAAAIAREVFTGHLATLIDNGGELPPARDLDALRADADIAEDLDEALTTVMLPALLPAGRSRRVNLSLDENTLDLIDSSARDRGLTRSAFVAEACRAFATGGRAHLRPAEGRGDVGGEHRDPAYALWLTQCLAQGLARGPESLFERSVAEMRSRLSERQPLAPDLLRLEEELRRQFEASISRGSSGISGKLNEPK